MGEPKLTGFSKLRLGPSFRVSQEKIEKKELSSHLNQSTENVRRKIRQQSSRRKTRDWEDVCLANKRWTEEEGRSAMQTLDRRISVSSDQLDTINRRTKVNAPTRTRSSYRHLYVQEKNTHSKTPFEMFLEDDGPYSRKLFGPLSEDLEARKEGEGKEERKNHRKLSTRKINKVQRPEVTTEKENLIKPVKRGLLWQQKDRIFSRWRERYFVLTRDYISCFKKASSGITEMGSFVFKIKLADIEKLELLDKRGYLTVVITLFKDGKLWLRTTQGLQDWYNIIQAAMYESKKRRKFWVTGQGPVEKWLIDQQENEGSNQHCQSPPVHHQHHQEEGEEEETKFDLNNNNNNDNTVDINITRGINRISLVSGLLMSERVSEITSKDSRAHKSKLSNLKVSRDHQTSFSTDPPAMKRGGGGVKETSAGGRRIPYRGEIDPGYLDEQREEMIHSNRNQREEMIHSRITEFHHPHTETDSGMDSENRAGSESHSEKSTGNLKYLDKEMMYEHRSADPPDIVKSSHNQL